LDNIAKGIASGAIKTNSKFLSHQKLAISSCAFNPLFHWCWLSGYFCGYQSGKKHQKDARW